MIDSEYNTGIYNFLKISNEVVIKNPEMLRLVPDHLKTKKMCNHVVANSRS